MSASPALLELTALFKIVVTPHFGYMGGHAKYKSGVHSYLVKLELWNSYPPCLARQPTDISTLSFLFLRFLGPEKP